jgi:hypothetical protein
LRITGEPVITGKKEKNLPSGGVVTNSVKIQMQKKRLSLSSLVLSEQIPRKWGNRKKSDLKLILRKNKLV